MIATRTQVVQVLGRDGTSTPIDAYVFGEWATHPRIRFGADALELCFDDWIVTHVPTGGGKIPIEGTMSCGTAVEIARALARRIEPGRMKGPASAHPRDLLQDIARAIGEALGAPVTYEQIPDGAT